MKKSILIALIIISGHSFGQGYIGIGATNNGIQLSAGALSGNVDMQFKYQLPLFSLEAPQIVSITIGRMIPLTTIDKFSITPSIGYAWLKNKDFSLYGLSTREDNIITVQRFKPTASLEFGKDYWMGRIAINYTYCDANYFGISMRCFINRNTY